MKRLVLKAFIDKETHIGYSQGDMYESNDLERIAFLSGEGYIASPSSSSSPVEDTKPDPPQDDEFVELKAKAKELKIKGYTKMEKDELTQAIEAAEQVGE
ncbi:Rho termination factor N-terminal domain-containing protein [Bacillus manliponensis]|uniref:Rho termination factor N-terminal domain-containing protein n=1 Tax=Bacillus manliponensis TaxID=574376 RepID=UPI003512431B